MWFSCCADFDFKRLLCFSLNRGGVSSWHPPCPVRFGTLSSVHPKNEDIGIATTPIATAVSNNVEIDEPVHKNGRLLPYYRERFYFLASFSQNIENCMLLYPTPGFVYRCKPTKTGWLYKPEICYVNICHDRKVPFSTEYRSDICAMIITMDNFVIDDINLMTINVIVNSAFFKTFLLCPESFSYCQKVLASAMKQLDKIYGIAGNFERYEKTDFVGSRILRCEHVKPMRHVFQKYLIRETENYDSIGELPFENKKPDKKDMNYIVPKPGAAFKFRAIDGEGDTDNITCYINLCHHERMTAPSQITTASDWLKELRIHQKNNPIVIFSKIGRIYNEKKHDLEIRIDVIVSSSYFDPQHPHPKETIEMLLESAKWFIKHYFNVELGFYERLNTNRVGDSIQGYMESEGKEDDKDFCYVTPTPGRAFRLKSIKSEKLNDATCFLNICYDSQIQVSKGGDNNDNYFLPIHTLNVDERFMFVGDVQRVGEEHENMIKVDVIFNDALFKNATDLKLENHYEYLLSVCKFQLSAYHGISTSDSEWEKMDTDYVGDLTEWRVRIKAGRGLAPDFSFIPKKALCVTCEYKVDKGETADLEKYYAIVADAETVLVKMKNGKVVVYFKAIECRGLYIFDPSSVSLTHNPEDLSLIVNVNMKPRTGKKQLTKVPEGICN